MHSLPTNDEIRDMLLCVDCDVTPERRLLGMLARRILAHGDADPPTARPEPEDRSHEEGWAA